MTEQYEQLTLFDVSKYEKLDGSGNVTYNHMFDIAFAVPDSEYADGFRCLENEQDKVIKALLDRIESIQIPVFDIDAFGYSDTYKNEGELHD